MSGRAGVKTSLGDGWEIHTFFFFFIQQGAIAAVKVNCCTFPGQSHEKSVDFLFLFEEKKGKFLLPYILFITAALTKK